jgi:hypothetical protein
MVPQAAVVRPIKCPHMGYSSMRGWARIGSEAPATIQPIACQLSIQGDQGMTTLPPLWLFALVSAARSAHGSAAATSGASPRCPPAAPRSPADELELLGVGGHVARRRGCPLARGGRLPQLTIPVESRWPYLN